MEDDKTLRQKDRAYTHQEIQQMLDCSNEKVKAIILLLRSTGVRVGAIHSLCIRHLTRFEEYNLYQLLIYPSQKDNTSLFARLSQQRQSIHTYHTANAAAKDLQTHPLFLGLTFMPPTFSKSETR